MQHVGNAQQACSGQGMYLGATNQHGAGAQSQGLDHVGAVAHPAVQQQRHAWAHTAGNGRQYLERADYTIQYAPAVVGNDEGVSPQRHGLQRLCR